MINFELPYLPFNLRRVCCTPKMSHQNSVWRVCRDIFDVHYTQNSLVCVLGHLWCVCWDIFGVCIGTSLMCTTHKRVWCVCWDIFGVCVGTSLVCVGTSLVCVLGHLWCVYWDIFDVHYTQKSLVCVLGHLWCALHTRVWCVLGILGVQHKYFTYSG